MLTTKRSGNAHTEDFEYEINRISNLSGCSKTIKLFRDEFASENEIKMVASEPVSKSEANKVASSVSERHSIHQMYTSLLHKPDPAVWSEFSNFGIVAGNLILNLILVYN